MREIMEIVKGNINGRGELHLDVEATAILIQFLKLTSKAVDSYQSLVDQLEKEIEK